MRPAKTILSVAWCLLWLAFAGYCILAGRGRADLRNPLGPAFVPQPQASSGTFGILGDCHSYRRSLREFSRTAARRGVDFGILLGDFVDYDEDIAYRHFVARLGLPSFPVFLVRGNHEATDFRLRDTDRYRDYIPEATQFLVHAGILIGMLDNATGEFPDGTLEEARNEIVAFRQEFPQGLVLLAMHMPPTIPGARSTDLSASATRALLALCEEQHVDYLVCAHVHDHLEVSHGPTRIMVDGCGGGSLQDPSPEVHYLEFSATHGALAVATVHLEQDRPVLARIDYLLDISVPRFRWWFFTGACAILLREM